MATPVRQAVSILFVGGAAVFAILAWNKVTEEQRRMDLTAQAAGFADDAELKAASAKGFTRAEPYRLQVMAEAEGARIEKEARAAVVAKAKAEADEKKRIEDARFKEAAMYALILKKSMKNPDSFKLEVARRSDDGFYCFEYRATNSFNAIIPGQAIFGNGKAASSDKPGAFNPLWNKHCTKPAEAIGGLVYAFKSGLL